MERHNYFREMVTIYERLLDEESKKVFEARITYMLDDDRDNYMETMRDIYHDWQVPEIEEKRKDDQEIILFGCGHDGRQAYRTLMSAGYEIACYCDNYQCGEIVDGKKVLSVDEVLKEHGDALVVITSSKYGESLYIQLAQKGFPCQNILLPKYKGVVAVRGKQYFDVFEPWPDETYLDAGAFDGASILKFYEWSKGNYKKIYAFEPLKNMCGVISQKVQKSGIKNVEILNNAAWEREEVLNFSENGAGSKITTNGDVGIKGLDIDSLINREKITFIKMDIEGSELKALKGAEKTIRENKPRLAICIYHKRMDLIEIAAYLLKLVPEYKFYIRHYWSNMWETVLYALPFLSLHEETENYE